MRLETIPIILAVLIGLCGLMLIADAFIPDGVVMRSERRRRRRSVRRNQGGEAAIGLGILLVAAAVGGRDGWRYATLAILAATLLLAAGLVLNWRYLRTSFLREDPAAEEPGPVVTGAQAAEPVAPVATPVAPVAPARPERRASAR